MKPTITQHVIPRSRAQSGFRSAWRQPHPRRLYRQRGSINPATFTVSLAITAAAAVAALSFFYLGQVQNTAGQGTNIYNLEEKIIELRQRQKALELEGAQLRSIQTIERNVPQLNLVDSGKVTYLAAPGDKVARAD